MSDVRDPARDQALPVEGKLNVQDELIDYIKRDAAINGGADEAEEAMCRALLERKAYGIKKYGKPLQTENGRDALLDAWEEAVDLTSYLAQLMLEPSVPGHLSANDTFESAYDIFRDLTARRLVRGDKL